MILRSDNRSRFASGLSIADSLPPLRDDERQTNGTADVPESDKQ